MCKEYTAPRNQKGSRPHSLIDADQEIGPVLNVGVAKSLDMYGIEVQVPSLSIPERSRWIFISRGQERLVGEIHRHNTEIMNDSSLLRTKEENFENVSFESVKLASGNGGHGSDDSDIVKSNDKPSSEPRETAISTTLATLSRGRRSIVHSRYSVKEIPREDRIWDTIPRCQKCRNNSFETRISKCVTQKV